MSCGFIRDESEDDLADPVGSAGLDVDRSTRTARTLDDYIVFPGAVDRYNSEGDPRLVADAVIRANFRVANTTFAAGPVSGPLVSPCEGYAYEAVAYFNPDKPLDSPNTNDRVFRVAADPSHFCNEGG